MRQVVLDTETTGLDFRLGNRVIEIGCIELLDRKPTSQRFHTYLNPEFKVEAGALAVHGLSDEFLQDKPKFAEIISDFLDFVRGAELIIHNATFDMGFLNNELALTGLDPLEQTCSGVIDTLKMAKELHPGRRNSLDALCDRYAINNSSRTLHGALLDAELLAEVYLSMTRGQESLIIDMGGVPTNSVVVDLQPIQNLTLRVQLANNEELAEHDFILAEIAKESKGNCLWLLNTSTTDSH